MCLRWSIIKDVEFAVINKAETIVLIGDHNESLCLPAQKTGGDGHVIILSGQQTVLYPCFHSFINDGILSPLPPSSFKKITIYDRLQAPLPLKVALRTKTTLSLSLPLPGVHTGEGCELLLRHLSINKSSASVPATLKSAQPRRPSNKSLDLASLKRPVQSKYLRLVYLISPGSRHWKDPQWRVLLVEKKREEKVGEEEVTLSNYTLPAISAALWAGSISFGRASGWQKRTSLFPAYPDAFINTG